MSAMSDDAMPVFPPIWVRQVEGAISILDHVQDTDHDNARALAEANRSLAYALRALGDEHPREWAAAPVWLRQAVWAAVQYHMAQARMIEPR